MDEFNVKGFDINNRVQNETVKKSPYVHSLLKSITTVFFFCKDKGLVMSFNDATNHRLEVHLSKIL